MINTPHGRDARSDLMYTAGIAPAGSAFAPWAAPNRSAAAMR
ncbi:hypothetical protein ABZ806_02985 [Spirillospora sp. NPDC047418]|jgi:hypothetical protein